MPFRTCWFTRNLLGVRPLVPEPPFAFLPAWARSCCLFYAISCVSFPGRDFCCGGSSPIDLLLFPTWSPEHMFSTQWPVHSGWLGTHFQNGLEGQQIAYTINCRENCVGKQRVQAMEWPPLASVWAPPAPPPHRACQCSSSVWPTPDRWQLTHSVEAVKAKGSWVVRISHFSAQFYFLLVHLLASGPQVTYLCAYAWFGGLMTTQQEF